MARIYCPPPSTFQDVPRTLETAIEQLLAILSDPEKTRLRATSEADLEQFHFTIGVTVRQQFGLWRGNLALRQSCGCLHPDRASMAIIRATWERLRGELVQAS